MKLNDAFVIDIEVKKNYVPQAPNQADKRDSFAPIYRAAVHIYIYIYMHNIIQKITNLQCQVQYDSLDTIHVCRMMFVQRKKGHLNHVSKW